MIDQVLNDLIDEIAIEGDEGCTVEQLFSFTKHLIIKSLQTETLNRDICFDVKYKAYLWTQIRTIEQLVVIENGIAIDPSGITFEQLQLKSESSQILIKASKDAQDHNIYGSLKTAKKSLTDKHQLVLSTIAKSRNQGISQYKLGEILNMDSKTIFYYLKKLESLGLIVRETVYVDKMSTRIIFLKRFAEQKEEDSTMYRVGEFKDDCIRQLKKAKHNMMTLKELTIAMGFVTARQTRWARIKINKLHDEGVIEKFIASGDRTKASVRLPKTSNMTSIDPEPMEEYTSPIEYKEKFLRDLPGDYQFYQDLIAADEKGLVRQDLVDKYPELDPNVFKTFFENAASQPAVEEVTKYLIYRSEELAGRSRIYRYFSYNGWRKFNEKLGNEIAAPRPKLRTVKQNLIEPPSIDYIGKSYTYHPTTKIPISRLKNKKNKASDEEDEHELVLNTRAKKTRRNVDKTIDLIEPSLQSASNPESSPSASNCEPMSKRTIRKRKAQTKDPNDTPLQHDTTLEPVAKRVTPSRADDSERQSQTNPVLDSTSTSAPQKGKNLLSYFGKKQPNASVQQAELAIPTPISSNTPKPTETGSVSREPSPEESQTSSKESSAQTTSAENQHTIQFIDYNAPESPTRKRKRGFTAELNSTKLRREKILLDMMEEQRIRELNTDTCTEFNKIEKELSGGQKMAVLTFNKMAKQLHAKKKLKVHVSTVQKLYGLIEIKTFLLHSSLTPESEEVKQFIACYSHEKPPPVRKRKEFSKVEIQDFPMPSYEKPKEQKLALKYGWVKSKWIRAKKLHENLIEYYLTLNHNDNIVDMTEFTKRMPIQLLCHVCCNLPYEEEEFTNFLDVEDNRNIPLCELPENIQQYIFQFKSRIRYFVTLQVRILEQLGVIEPIRGKDTDSRVIAPKYKLSEEGLIRDYAFKDRAIVSVLPLKTLDDVHHFWEELYHVCMHPTRIRTDQDQNELMESSDKNDPIYNIHGRKGWAIDLVLPPKLKKFLDSFVDFENKTIRSDSIALRAYLRKETGLTTKRIRDYYQGLFGALDKVKKAEEKRKAMEERRLKTPFDPTINELMLASFEKRKVDAAIQKSKEEGPFIRSTFIGSRRFRKLRLRVEPDRDQLHTDNGGSKRLFHNFTEHEKDLILYSYCIMKSRAKRSRFLWGPITRCLTNRTAEQCRRVLNSMLFHQPELKITIERLISKWERYYKEGIERKEIKDKDPWDTLNFDLPSFLEYFFQKLMNEETQSNVAPKYLLPFQYKNLSTYFQIIRDEEHILKLKKETDDQSISVNAFNNNKFDAPRQFVELQNENISIELIKTLIKMLLVAPDNLYDASKAYKVISQYPLQIIENALDDLRSKGLIINSRSGYDRIPGRAYNVSEKYLKLSEGIVPFGLFDNARAHYDAVVKNEVLDLKNPNNGVVASTLDLISQGKVALDIKNRNNFFRAKESLSYPKRSAVALSRSYIYKGLELVLKKTGTLSTVEESNKPEYLDAKITLPSSTLIEDYLQELDQEDRLARVVYDIVHSFRHNGASFDDIMTRIRDNHDKKNVSDTLYGLINHEPPIIRIVGFKQLQYVASEFSACWFLKNGEDDTLLNPLMWNDLSGNIIEPALDGFSKAVISHILTSPGISHANLIKKFEGFFSEYELYILMRYLVDNNTVIARTVQQEYRPKKVSIFEKRQLATIPRSRGLMNSNEITFYWLSNDYYLSK